MPRGTPAKRKSAANDRQETSSTGERVSASLPQLSECKRGQAHPRTIFHFDLDCFYAQVEMVENPSLKDAPLGIQQKNIIVTCNYPARERGVRKLQRIKDAVKQCPELVIRDGSNLKRFRTASERILNFFQGITPEVERLGLDEFFIDATNMIHMHVQEALKVDASQTQDVFAGEVYRGEAKTVVETQTGIISHVGGETKADVIHCRCGCYERLRIGSWIAEKLRGDLFKQHGFTASAGISVSKMMAKLSGELHKPNMQTIMLPAYFDFYLRGLRVRKLPGCGYSSSKKLGAVGVEYISQLRQLTLPKLVDILGEQTGTLLHSLCRGEDHSRVHRFDREKTMSEEDSFRACDNMVDTEKRISGLLISLLERIDARFSRHGDLPTLIRLTVRDRASAKRKGLQSQGYFAQRHSKQMPVRMGFFHCEYSKREERLMGHLMDLFMKLVPTSRFHLTLLNVAVAKFQPYGGMKGKQKGIDFFLNRMENGTTPQSRETGSGIDANTCNQSKIEGSFQNQNIGNLRNFGTTDSSVEGISTNAEIKSGRDYSSATVADDLPPTAIAVRKGGDLAFNGRSTRSAPVTEEDIDALFFG